MLKKKIICLTAFLLLLFLVTACEDQQAAQLKDPYVSKKGNTTFYEKPKVDPSINSGLMLGLAKNWENNRELSPFKKQPGEYRTILIYQNGDELAKLERPHGIIAPTKVDFWKLQNSKFHLEELNDTIDPAKDLEEDIYSKYTSYYDFSNIVSHLASEKAHSLYTPESFESAFNIGVEGEINSYLAGREWLLYAGNKYASVVGYNYKTGGGSFNNSSFDIKIYEIANLKDLDSRRKFCPKLYDLLDKAEQEKLASLAEKYRKPVVLGEVFSKGQYLDLENLTLKRLDGKWQIEVPLYMETFHQGNGSQGKDLIKFISTDVNVPEAFISHDSLCLDWETIKQKIPDAKDAVSSPNKDMLAVLTPNKLLIFANPLDGIEKPHLSISVAEDEQIILNQWATGGYVKKWRELLDRV